MNHYLRWMHKPLVSILIPFKNTSQYLLECINSILEQTYTNWELLIVDDGSTDDSYTIVSDFASKDSRIHLYKNNDSGIIAALRLALYKSSGDLITRMDSDDIMTSNKLEVLSTNLINFGRQHIAIGMVKYFSENGIGEGYSKYESWLNTLTKNGSNFSEIYKECVIPSPCWMVYKEDLLACEAFYPDRYPEDYDLTFRFYEYGLKCIPCDTVLLHWRDYSTRTSRTHEHYAENHFLEIKLHYFLKLDHNNKRQLVLWGAGKKGKKLAQILIDQNIAFDWICDNPKKIGKQIYNQELKAFDYLATLNNPQSLITVANQFAQKEIKRYMKQYNMLPMIDYFFFC